MALTSRECINLTVQSGRAVRLKYVCYQGVYAYDVFVIASVNYLVLQSGTSPLAMQLRRLTYTRTVNQK